MKMKDRDTPAGARTVGRLLKLLRHHEHAAEAIRTTLELLNGSLVVSKKKTARGMMTQALELDALRREAIQDDDHDDQDTSSSNGHRGRGRPRKQPKAHHQSRRQQTAKTLAALSPTVPRPMPDPRGASVLLQHGYIKKLGDGYIRTAKPFSVEKPHT